MSNDLINWILVIFLFIWVVYFWVFQLEIPKAIIECIQVGRKLNTKEEDQQAMRSIRKFQEIL